MVKPHTQNMLHVFFTTEEKKILFHFPETITHSQQQHHSSKSTTKVMLN